MRRCHCMANEYIIMNNSLHYIKKSNNCLKNTLGRILYSTPPGVRDPN